MRRFAEQMGWAADPGGFAIQASVNERLGFLRKTYGLLSLQILAVGAIAAFVINTPFLLNNVAIRLYDGIMIYILVFMGLSFLTRRMLEGSKPLSTQYAAAGLWTFFLGLLISPLCYMASLRFGSYAIVGEAFVLTSAIFIGLTVYVFTTKKDFSFLRGAIWIASMSMLAIGALLYFTGNSGGIWYSVIWVGVLAAWTLYDTSKILHHRHTNEAVAASVDLLLDFVYLFIHILMILMRSRD